MSKKITSLILALVLMFSMTTIACVSVSATVNEDGTYTPTDPDTETYRYYFYMPTWWYTNDDVTTAGIYWYAGTDACGALDGSGNSVSWPGYTAYADETYDQLFYCDVPTDVETIIWDNLINGETDSTAAIFWEAMQTINIFSTYYAADYSENYDQDFFDEVQAMLDTYSADELAEISPYYSNFYVDDSEWDEGLCFTFDNMIYIVDQNVTVESAVTEGKYTYGGDWYFYYGDGSYGLKLTKEEAMEAEENKAEDDTRTYYMTIAEAASADEAVEVTVPETSGSDGDDSTTATEATTADTDDDDDSTAATTSTDATSATTAADASSSTSDTASTTTTTTDNSAVQTGAAPYAVVFLVLLLAACGALYYTKRKAD
ncbi:MAG: hypothetical protein LUF33_05075 [Clostridiales bacterium]|nr:hypothetical protein [Clostridiales bacterium]